MVPRITDQHDQGYGELQSLQSGNRATQMVSGSVKKKKYCRPALSMAVLQPCGFYVLCCSNMRLYCAKSGW